MREGREGEGECHECEDGLLHFVWKMWWLRLCGTVESEFGLGLYASR